MPDGDIFVLKSGNLGGDAMEKKFTRPNKFIFIFICYYYYYYYNQGYNIIKSVCID